MLRKSIRSPRNVIRQVMYRRIGEAPGVIDIFEPFDRHQVRMPQQPGLHARAHRALVHLVDEAAGADVDDQLAPARLGIHADHRLGQDEMAAQRRDVEDIEPSRLGQHPRRRSGEVRGIGNRLAGWRRALRRVGILRHVQALRAQIVDQTAIGRFIATPRGLARLGDRAAIGDAWQDGHGGFLARSPRP